MLRETHTRAQGGQKKWIPIHEELVTAAARELAQRYGSDGAAANLSKPWKITPIDPIMHRCHTTRGRHVPH